MLGIVANARGCWPSPADIGSLGLRDDWIRSIVYSFDEFDAALSTTPAGVKICALLRKECAEVGSNYENWNPAVLKFARRFKDRVHACEVDNEADLNGDSPSHSVDLLLRAKDTLLSFGMRPILTSVAGPNWQDYLSQCRTLLGSDAVDCWGALHPYGSRAGNYPSDTWGFGEISAQVRRAHDLLGLPIAVTECGVKIRDMGGEPQHAMWIIRANDVLQALPADVMPFATLFCLGDEMGSPGEQGLDGFGLRRLDGSHRPAWTAFSNVNGGPLAQPSTPPAEQHEAFVLGFKAIAERHPALVGRPLRDERGPWLNCSTQPTDRGILLWGDFVGAGSRMAFIGSDGRLWLWTGDHLEAA